MNESNTNNMVEDVVVKNDRKDRQPWHQPTLKRLRLSLDTAEAIGSATDGLDGSLLIDY